MIITIIVAVANNGVIGGDNKLLWHLPADLKMFKQTTLGHTIIMGRKTFESIGKPLPGRNTIVVSRNKSLVIEGVTIANSMDEALLLCNNQNEVFITGGAQIYRQALHMADRIILTRVHADFEGDTFFHQPDLNVFDCISKQIYKADEKNIFDFTIETYKRKGSSQPVLN